jgi:hypothetical protein
MTQQPFGEAQYTAKVWAGTASAAILAVTIGASLWIFFGQSAPRAMQSASGSALIHAGPRP